MYDTINRIMDLNIPTIAIPKLSISAILDILVIAFFLYKILLWIKQFRAWILFRGIIILLFVSAVSYIIDMKTVFWVISNAFSVGIIALIVIFQPELRKALENLGKGKVSSFLPNGNSATAEELLDYTIEEIIAASSLMSNARTGALMVLEREVPLGDIAATGIPIDAVVTRQLLVNIFENKTPLHDGAVLIHNGRITAATCILPLTQDKLSSELGTRHRAGVGVSEVSDAYVVIVSEETGNVSIVREGTLNRNVTPEEMREMLSDLKTRKGFGPKGKRKSRPKKGREK